MKLNEILTESLTDIVYHKTMGDSFYNIVKTDELHLELLAGREVFGGDHKASGSRFYYGSFARSPLSHFIQRANGTVIMEIDGQLLSSNYRARPVDFFSGITHNQDEMEDRLYSYEPVIKNFSRYIRSVHILRGVNDFDLIKAAAKHLHDNYGVDIFMYRDRGDFVMLRNGVREDFEEDMEPDFSSDYEGENEQEHMRYHYKNYETLVHAIEFLEADDFNELSDGAQEELRFMQGTPNNFIFNVREAVKKVLPNNKITVEFTKRMRQYGVSPNDLNTLGDIIRDKWL